MCVRYFAYEASEVVRAGSKKKLKEVTDSSQVASLDFTEVPLFFWHHLIYIAEYRRERLISEVMVFPNGEAYYVCPRCKITLEREFMRYCDRCGQHLGWKEYKKAKVIYPSNRQKTYT